MINTIESNHSRQASDGPHHPPLTLFPKVAAVIGDSLFPMPRQKLTARDILDQAGLGPEFILQRDHGDIYDEFLEDGAEVDLGLGNVFRAIPRCEAAPQPSCSSPAKLAFVLEDDWKVTLIAGQTGHTLKRLFGLPDDVELLRDYASPHDVPIQNEERVWFEDGFVFTARKLSITVKVNNLEVRSKKRRLSVLDLKRLAIAQGVSINESCVLYPLKPDGSLGAALGDDVILTLKECDAFSCVEPDDNS
jgi:hypothetical protein